MSLLLGAFRSTPISILEAETGLLPLRMCVARSIILKYFHIMRYSSASVLQQQFYDWKHFFSNDDCDQSVFHEVDVRARV